jgi:hypothetical protein
VAPSLLLREGKVAEAREAVKHMPTAPRYHRDLLEACLQLKPESELDRLATESETSYPSDPDPETWYYEGALFAYCGKKKAAIHLLQSAIENNYCAYSNLLTDPLLTKFRSDPDIDKLLTAAHQCQEAVKGAAGTAGQ